MSVPTDYGPLRFWALLEYNATHTDPLVTSALLGSNV